MKPREEKERIVWQNQSHLVLDYLKTQKGDVLLLDLCLITDALADWCMNGKSQEGIDKLKQIDKYIRDGKTKN